MKNELILGPILRYAGESDATIWVETDTACEVEARVEGSAHASPTFEVEGHHYALVRIIDLAPGETYEYEVFLDGEKAWPETDSGFPPSVIRTISPDGGFELAFGSCRVAAPHEAPHILGADEDSEGHGRDALYMLALRMMEEAHEEWPDALFLLGDQIYADEVSPATREFIRGRRNPEEPPGEEIADFEEYTHLYHEAWRDPTIRWLLSNVPSAMIFDDHDVNDDWNISEAWVETMRKRIWWDKRIIGAFMSYWIYQHLGNLSPRELEEDEIFNEVLSNNDATRVLREFAYVADREIGRSRWSFYRDFGKVRLIVMDTRAGRVLEEGDRAMIDEEEWRWIEDKANGDFDHLLFGTSLPFVMPYAVHHVETWNEAVCAGAWGKTAAKVAETVRQAVDLEHWPAFGGSFESLAELLRSAASGERSGGKPPASVTVLSGDVHHGYLAEMDLGGGAVAHQAVGSPIRNHLGRPERLVLRFGWTRLGKAIGKTLARLAGVEETKIRWRLVHDEPWFDNHISAMKLDGREARITVEKTVPEDEGKPSLRTILERRLA
ncbi:MAG: alkaline phosphatase family protein [Rubrobacter sp.]|nr:alkaline phosphatase family protein [Rubrobacter sp.]